MKFSTNTIFSVVTSSLILVGCGGAPTIVSTPIENIDKVPLKHDQLTEKQLKNWNSYDLVTDTIPGMSVIKAYDELLKGKKGQTVIVGVYR